MSKKKKETRKAAPSSRPKSTRIHRLSLMLNNEEQKTLERFLTTYKISNKSRWLRETIFTAVLKKFDEDHPTLF